MSASVRIDLATPFEKFPDKIQNLLLNGEPARGGKTGFLGILGHLQQNLESSTSDNYRDYLLDFMSATECSVCHGKRLRPESLAVKVNGMSIADFTELPIARALEAARKIKLTGRELTIAGRIAHEITERLEFLHRRRARVLAAWPLGRNALGRRRPAHPAGHADRIEVARRALRSRRAFHRTAPPRQRTASCWRWRICATSAIPCSSSSMMKRPSAARTM